MNPSLFLGWSGSRSTFLGACGPSNLKLPRPQSLLLLHHPYLHLKSSFCKRDLCGSKVQKSWKKPRKRYKGSFQYWVSNLRTPPEANSYLGIACPMPSEIETQFSFVSYMFFNSYLLKGILKYISVYICKYCQYIMTHFFKISILI